MRILRSNLMRFCAMMIAAVMFSGCTSILTASGPVRTELIDGKRSVGEFVRNEYRAKMGSNKLFVFKTPLCSEKVEKIRVEQKPVLCWSCAMAEMVVFGYGFIDLARATAISEESRKEVKIAEYTTNRLLTCGDLQPASGEVIVIENEQRNLYRKAMTNRNGVLDLKAVMGESKETIRLDIHLESDKSVAFSHLYTVN